MIPLELYGYQKEMIALLRQAFQQGHRAIILVAPTGAGKTEIAIALLQAALGNGHRAAMLLDRVVLCDQTSARLDKYGIAHGVMQSGHWRHRPYEPIQICSAQTLEKRGSFPGLKLLIVDEAHQTRKQTAEFIRNNPDVYVVGLTATPFTKGLGRTYSHVVSSVTTQELVKMNKLVGLRVYVAKEIDMTGAKKVAGEWSDDEVTKRALKITGDVVTEWVKKTHEVFGGPRKTIVFCAGVAHGADLAAKFAAAGYNFVCLSYKDNDQFKKDAIAEFSKPDSTIHGLIATDLLTKGFDVPDLMIGISARPFSQSLSAHMQQIGRVMRMYLGKDFALWLDHSGNYLRFQDDWDEIYEIGVSQLDEGKEKNKKELTEKQKSEAKCPKCLLLWPLQTDTCPSCGHVRERSSTVSAAPGEMHEISICPSAHKSRWYGELISIGDARNHSPKWANNKYKEKFGSWPNGLARNPAIPLPEVLRWVKSVNIRWAKSKLKRFGQSAAS